MILWPIVQLPEIDENIGTSKGRDLNCSIRSHSGIKRYRRKAQHIQKS